MKRSILAISTAATLVMTAGLAHAAPKATTENKSAALALMLGRVLDSIDAKKTQLQFSVTNASIFIPDDSKDEKEITVDEASIKATIVFNRAWTFDPAADAGFTTANAQVKKLIPDLLAETKDLTLAMEVKDIGKNITMQAAFFAPHDPKSKQWTPRPIVLKVRSNVNSALYVTQIYSLQAQVRVNKKFSVQEITGTCKAEDILFNPNSGLNEPAEVNCIFSGVKLAKGWKLTATYSPKN